MKFRDTPGQEVGSGAAGPGSDAIQLYLSGAEQSLCRTGRRGREWSKWSKRQDERV